MERKYLIDLSNTAVGPCKASCGSNLRGRLQASIGGNTDGQVTPFRDNWKSVGSVAADIVAHLRHQHAQEGIGERKGNTDRRAVILSGSEIDRGERQEHADSDPEGECNQHLSALPTREVGVLIGLSHDESLAHITEDENGQGGHSGASEDEGEADGNFVVHRSAIQKHGDECPYEKERTSRQEDRQPGPEGRENPPPGPFRDGADLKDFRKNEDGSEDAQHGETYGGVVLGHVAHWRPGLIVRLLRAAIGMRWR